MDEKLNDDKKKPCKFCDDINSKEARIRITCKGVNKINDFDYGININYCPFCGRKL